MWKLQYVCIVFLLLLLSKNLLQLLPQPLTTQHINTTNTPTPTHVTTTLYIHIHILFSYIYTPAFLPVFFHLGAYKPLPATLKSALNQSLISRTFSATTELFIGYKGVKREKIVPLYVCLSCTA